MQRRRSFEFDILGNITDLPWTPSISYRFAHASGDDPRINRYDCFDPLLSTGLGNWLKGIPFGKLTTNSNLAVHRVQFNVAPNPSLNRTFNFHQLIAPQLNNFGSNAAAVHLCFVESRAIAQRKIIYNLLILIDKYRNW